MSSPFSDADQEIQIIKAYVAAVTCKTLHSDFVNMAEVSMADQIEVQAPTLSLVFAGNLVLSCSGHVDRPVPPACLIECGYFCKHGCNNRAHVFSKQCDHFQRRNQNSPNQVILQVILEMRGSILSCRSGGQCRSDSIARTAPTCIFHRGAM